MVVFLKKDWGKGGCMVRPQRTIGSYERPKKIEIIRPLHCYLSDPVTNNQIKVRRSMINKIL